MSVRKMHRGCRKKNLSREKYRRWLQVQVAVKTLKNINSLVKKPPSTNFIEIL